MLPKHIDRIPNENRRAVAPYNFVELPEQIVAVPSAPASDRYHSKRLTGKISCELTTASPLYIRGGFTPEDFAKHGDQPSSTEYLSGANVTEAERQGRSDFFAYPNVQKPVIPGSSLRGMVRSLVEIISYGKVDKVTDSQLVYRSVGDTTSLKDHYRDRLVIDNTFQQQAGYLQRVGSEWFIQPALLIEGQPFARISIDAKQPSQNLGSKDRPTVKKPVLKKKNNPKGNNQKISFQLTDDTDYTGLPIVNWVASGGTDGCLVKTGRMQKKKYNCVFGLEDPDKKKAIPLSYEMVGRYRDQITKEQGKLLGDKENAALQNGQPIFYLIEDDELTFFGHAMMFRLPYPSSVRQFIPEQLRNTAKNTEITDLSEAIFGYVRNQKQSKNQVLKSRVSFSDAKCLSKESDIWLKAEYEALTPKILSGPKPTTFQHYLVQPKHTGARKNSLKHYHSKPVEDTVIRGHKLYWHQGKVGASDIEASIQKPSSQHTEIKPVGTGVRFKFDVHFENLSEVEIGALLWVFDIAQSEQYRLSIGMGKPLGMGAISIAYSVKMSDRQQRYSQLLTDNGWEEAESDVGNTFKQTLISTFERFMLDKETGISKSDHPRTGRAATLKEVPRIEMLLAMLRFDQPLPSEQTRYMTIQPKPNEYRDRPVLPTPLDIMGVDDNRQLSTSEDIFDDELFEEDKAPPTDDALNALLQRFGKK